MYVVVSLSYTSSSSSSSIHLASQVFFVVLFVLCSGLLHCGAMSYVKCIGLYRFRVFCLHRFLSVVVVVVWYIVWYLNWTTKFDWGKHMSIYINCCCCCWGIVESFVVRLGLGQVRLGWVRVYLALAPGTGFVLY